MSTMKNVMAKLAGNEEGAALVEYGMLVALIAVVCVAAVATLGQSILKGFTTINTEISK